MTIIIAENQTVGDIELKDMGISVPGSGLLDLTSLFTVNEIQDSADLVTEITNDNILIDDGGGTLTKTQSLSIVDTLALKDPSTDVDAIHDNVNGEIVAVTLKVTPVNADVLLIEDSAAADAKKRITVGSLPTGGGGEANTASNVNVGGQGIFKQKTGVDLEFRGINAGSSKISVALDAVNNEIDIDVNEGNVDHDALTNFVANEHIDWTAASAGTVHTDNYIEGGNGTDGTAIHDDTAGEISAVAVKAAPVAADKLLIEDSAAADAKKSITMGAIDHDALTNFVANEHIDWTSAGTGTVHTDNYIEGGDGTDTTAIHDDTSGEIVAVALKATPVSADVLLIEDSAATNAKKRITVGSLPTGGGGEANTASNVNVGGQGVFKQKTGIDLEFRGINAGSSKISVALDAGNNEIDIDVNEANVDHDALTNFVANEHIDWTAASAGTVHTSNYIEGGDGTDGTAIHDDTSGEIAAVALKATPVSADVLLIEDSAATNAKKRITVGSLPGGGGGAVWTRITETTAARSAADGEFILVNVATCVITLPAPTDNVRVAVKVISSTVTDVQVRTSGAGILIDGTDYSSVGLDLKKQYEQISVISDGTNWWIY